MTGYIRHNDVNTDNAPIALKSEGFNVYPRTKPSSFAGNCLTNMVLSGSEYNSYINEYTPVAPTTSAVFTNLIRWYFGKLFQSEISVISTDTELSYPPL